jgi:hypothetical protein
MKPSIAVLAVILALADSALASPQPLNLSTNVSNLASSDNAFVPIDNNREATAFTTGSASSTLFAADLLLDAPNQDIVVQGPGLGHPNNAAGYDAYIYSNASGAPGSLVYTLTEFGPPGTKTLVVFTAPANSTLAADTTYWLVLKTAQTSYQGMWEATTSDSVTSPVGWTIAGGADFLTGGTTSDTPLFQIVVTPEPGTLALAGLGSLGLFLFRRRA